MEHPERHIRENKEKKGGEEEKAALVEKKVGVSAVPFYDGLLEMLMFLLVAAVNCTNRATCGNIVKKYFCFHLGILNDTGL